MLFPMKSARVFPNPGVGLVSAVATRIYPGMQMTAVWIWEARSCAAACLVILGSPTRRHRDTEREREGDSERAWECVCVCVSFSLFQSCLVLTPNPDKNLTLPGPGCTKMLHCFRQRSRRSASLDCVCSLWKSWAR